MHNPIFVKIAVKDQNIFSHRHRCHLLVIFRGFPTQQPVVESLCNDIFFTAFIARDYKANYSLVVL